MGCIIMGLLLKVAEIFNVPREVIAGIARVEITGTGEVLIENHGGILEYGTSAIAVSGGKAIIKIVGDNLQILTVTSSELTIRGLVLGVEFLI